MNITIKGEFKPGIINAPSSKSFSQRYILYSAFSNIPVSLKNLSFSEDEIVAIKIAMACGASIKFDGCLKIYPKFKCPKTINACESGTSLRLVIGLLAAKRCRTFIYENESLRKRPINDLIKTLEGKNIVFKQNNDGILMDASFSNVSDSKIDGSKSSQFVSSMMMYHSILLGHLDAYNVVSTDYIKITMKCLNDLGVSVKNRDYKSFDFYSNYIKNSVINIEGDYSSAAFWIILGIFKGDIEIKNLKINSCQPDSKIIEIINSVSERKIDVYDDKIIVHKTRILRDLYIDVNDNPDLAPPISIIGIFSDVSVHILNYKRLEIKESNRAENIISMASSFGAFIKKSDDEIIVSKGEIKRPRNISFNDHRMIMSSIIAGLISSYNIIYEDVENINKSYPSFLKDLSSLGYKIEFIDNNLKTH